MAAEGETMRCKQNPSYFCPAVDLKTFLMGTCFGMLLIGLAFVLLHELGLF
jgi:hypothetical protein